MNIEITTNPYLCEGYEEEEIVYELDNLKAFTLSFSEDRVILAARGLTVDLFEVRMDQYSTESGSIELEVAL
jgi:hypothetical protein